MTLHNFPCFVALNKFRPFVISPKHCSAIHLLMLGRLSVVFLSWEYENFQAFFPLYVPKKFQLPLLDVKGLSFLFPFYPKLRRCSHIQSMALSFLLLQISFSSVRCLFSIHSHIGGLILHNSQVIFLCFKRKFSAC